MDINNLTTASTQELHEDLLNCAKAAADPASSQNYVVRLHVSIARMAAELQRRDVERLLSAAASGVPSERQSRGSRAYWSARDGVFE